MTSEQISAVLLAVVPAIISAYLAAQLSVRAAIKSHLAERWWERKEKAYAEIIEALYNVARDYETSVTEYYEQREMYTKERREKIDEAGREGVWTIKRAIAMGNFVVSDEVAGTLVDLRKGLDGIEEERDFGSIYSEQLDLYKLALELIRNLAREDLKRGQV